MNCHDYQELLQRRLDGEHVDDVRAAREHVADCLDCRHLQQSAELLLEHLRLQPVATPPAELKRRIVGRVVADRRNRLARRALVRVRLVRYFAVAATVLLAVLGGMYGLPLLRSPAPRQEPELIVTKDAPPSLEKGVEEARQAVASLTDKSTSHLRTLISVANPMEDNGGVVLPAVGEMQSLEPAVSLRQAGQGVSEGLQAVASSTQRAFAFFIREFTPADAGKQKDSRLN